jgi:hypothetical protein
LAKFASKIHVSTHGLEATEAALRPSAILLGVDRELYRRRQRRRAIIGWSTLGLIVAIVALAVIGGAHGRRSDSGLPAFEMTSRQYVAIHKGETEASIEAALGGTGLREAQLNGTHLLSLFPTRPPGSTCSYWTLSDAPGHLVRLCFGDPASVLLQKAVAAQGEGEQAPKTLV